MIDLPSVNFPAIVLGAVLSFAWGGLYWGVAAKSVSRVVGLNAEAQKMPPTALAVAFGSRVLQSIGVAIVLAFAGVGEAGVGALASIGLSCLLVLPILIGQAAFGSSSGGWPRLAVVVPEVLVGFAIMGATVVLWR